MGLLSNFVREQRIKFCLPYINKGDRVLEIGCGNMYVTKNLRKKGVNITGIDIEPPADIVGDIKKFRELGLKERGFDVIIAFEVIEHVDLTEPVRALLKLGGLFILTTPVPSMDWLLRMMESVGLNQKRTSPHSNLTDIKTLPFETVNFRKAFGMMQWAVLQNL